MDPVSALGVAAAAVQFLQFSLQALDTCRQIRDDAKASTRQNRELEEAIRDVKAARQELKASDKIRVPRRIAEAARNCVKDADDLLRLLEHVRGAGGQISTAKATFRALKERRAIEKLEKASKDKQEQLNQLLVQGIWSQTQLAALQQSAEFAKLSGDVRDLLQSLLEQKANLSKQMEDLHMETSKHIVELDRKAEQRRDNAERDAELRSNRALEAGQYDQFLATLFFPEMDDRRNSVKDAAPGTLEWLYENRVGNWDSLVDFLSMPQHPTYWVSGKAGSGKSTLMAHIVDDARTKELLKIWSGGSELCMISFYFWKSGSFLQNSTIGLLRSLVYQVCRAQPRTAKEIIKSSIAVVGCMPSWTERTLRAAAAEALRIAKDVYFAVFIDGLDEFTGEYDALLDLIVDIEKFDNVKLCLSSRPEIELSRRLIKYQKLRLEYLNEKDISKYVVQKLEKDYPSENPSNTWIYRTLPQDITYGASGIFLWAALVTRDVLKGLYSGDGASTLQDRIQSTPQELDELFASMVKKLDRHHRRSLGFFLCSTQLARTMNVCWLTSAQLDGEIENYEEFLASCRRTQTQVLAQSGGLLEVEQNEEVPFRLWRNCRPHHMSAMDDQPDVSPTNRKHTLHSGNRRWLCSEAEPYPQVLTYESCSVKWIHRSAYDSIFGTDPMPILLDLLPDGVEVYRRLFAAGLRFVKAAPSCCTTNLFTGTIERSTTYDRICELLILTSRVAGSIPFADVAACLDSLYSVVDHFFPEEVGRLKSMGGDGEVKMEVCCQQTSFLLECTSCRLWEYLSHRLEQLMCGHLGEAIILATACRTCGFVEDKTSHQRLIKGLVPLVMDKLDYIEVHAHTFTENQVIANHFFYYLRRDWTWTFFAHRARFTTSGEYVSDNTLYAIMLVYSSFLAGKGLEYGRASGCMDQFLDKLEVLAESIEAYSSYGFDGILVSLHFPSRHLKGWMDRQTNPVQSFRIVCFPQWIVNARRSMIPRKFREPIVFEPSSRTCAPLLRVLFQRTPFTRDELANTLEESQVLLVEDVWANEHGLSAKDQLLALACIKIGLRETLLDSSGTERALRENRYGWTSDEYWNTDDGSSGTDMYNVALALPKNNKVVT